MMRSHPANTLFVAGTDTSVGKTYVCTRLLEFMRSQGIDVGYQKWIATGADTKLPEDLRFCLAAAEIFPTPELLALHVPYCFRFPASPHLAAELEDRTVDPAVIRDNYATLAARHDWLIVEGVGGIMVPLRRDLLLIDLLAKLLPRTLVVARSGLGTLNHTLLTLEALRSRQIPVLGVVFSDTETRQDERLVQDNLQTIEEMGLVRVFGRLQWQQDLEKAQKEFQPVGHAILEELHQAR